MTAIDETPLRKYRKETGETLVELAKRIRLPDDRTISQGQLSRIERTGKTSLPTAVAIERATGIPAAALVVGDEAAA